MTKGRPMDEAMAEYEARFGVRPDVTTFLIGAAGEELIAKALRDALDRGTPLTLAEVYRLNQRLAPPPGAVR